MKLLTLDLATHTGFCWTRDGRVIHRGLMKFDEGVIVKGEFNRRPAILLNAYRDIEEQIELNRPEFVVAEIPHLRGGQQFQRDGQVGQ